MPLLLRIVHVLALGLWFGATIFFTFVVGLSLFGTFEQLSAQEDRPFWYPLPPELQRPRPSERFPEPLRKEQGSRTAGAAVGPMFPWYFGIQTVCGLLTLATALAWWGRPGTVHRVRTAVVVLALVTVAAGWWLDGVVEQLREQRSRASDAVLLNPQPTSQDVQQADAARGEFGRWHFYSLMGNFGTVALVTVAMGLAAVLPHPGASGAPRGS